MPESPTALSERNSSTSLADYVFATYATDARLCTGIIALLAENSEMRSTIRSLRVVLGEYERNK